MKSFFLEMKSTCFLFISTRGISTEDLQRTLTWRKSLETKQADRWTSSQWLYVDERRWSLFRSRGSGGLFLRTFRRSELRKEDLRFRKCSWNRIWKALLQKATFSNLWQAIKVLNPAHLLYWLRSHLMLRQWHHWPDLIQNANQPENIKSSTEKLSIVKL